MKLWKWEKGVFSCEKKNKQTFKLILLPQNLGVISKQQFPVLVLCKGLLKMLCCKLLLQFHAQAVLLSILRVCPGNHYQMPGAPKAPHTDTSEQQTATCSPLQVLHSAAGTRLAPCTCFCAAARFCCLLLAARWISAPLSLEGRRTSRGVGSCRC